jgi:hypothetical protein
LRAVSLPFPRRTKLLPWLVRAAAGAEGSVGSDFGDRHDSACVAAAKQEMDFTEVLEWHLIDEPNSLALAGVNQQPPAEPVV